MQWRIGTAVNMQWYDVLLLLTTKITITHPVISRDMLIGQQQRKQLRKRQKRKPRDAIAILFLSLWNQQYVNLVRG